MDQIQRKADSTYMQLPSKYLKHLSIIGESPNTVRVTAYAITYYLKFLKEMELKLKDVFEMSFGKQTEHF